MNTHPCFCILLAFSASGCSELSVPTPSKVFVGAIVDVSGGLGGRGPVRLAALQVGYEDARDELKEQGIELDYRWEDGQTDPTAASIALNGFLQEGARVVVGPYTSAQVAAVQNRTVESESLILSPSSTSLEVAAAGDHIFRLAPNDERLVAALAARMRNEGRSKLVIIYRADSWGRSLSSELAVQFKELGGEVVSSAGYQAIRTTVMDELLDNARLSVMSDLTTDASSVAISIITFSEGSMLLDRARINQPLLHAAGWYGSDGFVHDSSLLSPETLARFARDVGFVAPLYSVEVSAGLEAVKSRIESIAGTEANTYDLLSYDAIRIAARLSAAVPGGGSADDLIDAIPGVLDGFAGLSGVVRFDTNGDRDDDAYDFYGVIDSPEGFRWALAGS